MQQITHLGTLLANNSMPEQHSWCVTPRIRRCNHITICLTMMLQSPTIISQGRFICRSDTATITHFVLTDRCIYYWMMEGIMSWQKKNAFFWQDTCMVRHFHCQNFENQWMFYDKLLAGHNELTGKKHTHIFFGKIQWPKQNQKCSPCDKCTMST